MCHMSEAELTQYKDKNHVDEILRELELEREKNAQLSLQLQQQFTRLLVLYFGVFSVTFFSIKVHNTVFLYVYSMSIVEGCYFFGCRKDDIYDRIPSLQL